MVPFCIRIIRKPCFPSIDFGNIAKLAERCTYMEVAKKIKSVLDPDNIMHPMAWEGVV
ncbi:MAG: hypothetical protein QXL96_01610 [Ignisphaera sp.]